MIVDAGRAHFVFNELQQALARTAAEHDPLVILWCARMLLEPDPIAEGDAGPGSFQYRFEEGRHAVLLTYVRTEGNSGKRRHNFVLQRLVDGREQERYATGC